MTVFLSVNEFHHFAEFSLLNAR